MGIIMSLFRRFGGERRTPQQPTSSDSVSPEMARAALLHLAACMPIAGIQLVSDDYAKNDRVVRVVLPYAMGVDQCSDDLPQWTACPPNGSDSSSEELWQSWDYVLDLQIEIGGSAVQIIRLVHAPTCLIGDISLPQDVTWSVLLQGGHTLRLYWSSPSGRSFDLTFELREKRDAVG